jgi:four helix bundle protein
MTNKEFSERLEERTRKFAIRIISLSTSLNKTPENLVIKNQLTKSGTSIGANYSEANRARSRRDFSNKIKICESEANETVYWLKIIIEIRPDQNEKAIEVLIEAKEILAIFTSIGKSLKL